MKLKCNNPKHKLKIYYKDKNGRTRFHWILGYVWDYKGKSDFYATCPRCHKLINIRKVRK